MTMLYRVPFRLTIELVFEVVTDSEPNAIMLAKQKLAETKPLTINPPTDDDWASERASVEIGWITNGSGWTTEKMK